MTDAPPRRPWLAALLAALCQGLGHLYAGRPLAAIAVHAVSIAIGVAAVFALRQGLGLVVAATIGSFAFWLAQAILAARAARHAAAGPRRWFSHPLALLMILGAAVVESTALGSFLKANVAQTAYMPSGSMTPTLRPGDYFVIAAGGPRELGGAVVLFAAPPSNPRRDDIVRRVVAVEGDTVELRDGLLVVNGEPVP